MHNQVIEIWEKYWGDLTINRITKSLLEKIDNCLNQVEQDDKSNIIDSFISNNSSLYLFHRWLYYNTYFDNESSESEVTLITSDMFKSFPIKKNKIDKNLIEKNKVEIFSETQSSCPNCFKIGNLIDNRETKKIENINWPDFKCEDRRKHGCGWAIWIESTSPPYGWLNNQIPSTVYDLNSQNEFSNHIFKEIKDTNLLTTEKLKVTSEFYFNKEVKRKFWNLKNRTKTSDKTKQSEITNLFKRTRNKVLDRVSVNIENIEEVLKKDVKKIKPSEKNQNYINKIEKQVISEGQKYVGRNRVWIGERIKIIQDEKINYSSKPEETKNLSGKNANFKRLKKARLDNSKNYKNNVEAVFDGICDCVSRKKVPPTRKVLMSFKKAAILARKWNQRPYSCPSVPGKFHLTTMKDVPKKFRNQAFKDLKMYGEEFDKLGIEIG